MTLQVSASACQRTCEPWPIQRLLEQRVVALGMALENMTAGAYQLHVNSYLTFCHAHNFPIDLTPDMLSFFIVYMSTYIKPQSIQTYLSGIMSSLDPYYPDVCKNRSSALVCHTLTGCTKMRGSAASWKLPFATSDLQMLLSVYGTSADHDDLLFLLFLAITFTSFHGLMRLGELVMHDNPGYQSLRKAIKCHSVKFHHNPQHFVFTLPAHKADRLYEGSTIVIEQRNSDIDPLVVFHRYLLSRDRLHPWHPLLWLLQSGSLPTCMWYI